MKTQTFAIIVFLILMSVIFWLLTKEPEYLPLDQTETILQLQDDLDQSRTREADLKLEDSMKALRIDLLQNQIIQIENDIQHSTQAIDHELELDSTLALEENRKALRDLGIITGTGINLSNFEMGWNAKFLRENIGMKLKIKKHEEKDIEQDNRLAGKDKIIIEKETQLTLSDSLKVSAEKQMEYLEAVLKERSGFFYNRFVFYGGVGLNYSGTQLAPGIQLGFGINIYAVKF